MSQRASAPHRRARSLGLVEGAASAPPHSERVPRIVQFASEAHAKHENEHFWKSRNGSKEVVACPATTMAKTLRRSNNSSHSNNKVQQQGASASGPAKQNLRSLQRLLSRGTLPPEVRIAKEAQVAALQGDVQKQSRVNREKHFSKKYHGVKFVERRKVERKIGQLQRRVAQLQQQGGSDEAATAEGELREAEHDLLYIQHFPRSKKYLSLFPTGEDENEYVIKRRRQIRALIVRRVEAGLPVGRLEDDAEDDEALARRAAKAEAKAEVKGETTATGDGGGFAEDDFFAADAEDDAVADDDFFGAQDDDQGAEVATEQPSSKKKRRDGDGGGGSSKRSKDKKPR